MDVPNSLKSIAPFVKHGNQLEKADPVMAYYCLYYAVQEGVKLRGASGDPESRRWLLALMDRLETMKRTLAARFSELAGGGEEYVRAFALRVFNAADDEDRQGRANKKTALNFYAAFQFMDVLRQFGEFPEDLLERYKYAKFKAADISAALKANRVPTPGPPGGDPLADIGSGAAWSEPAGPLPPSSTIFTAAPAASTMARDAYNPPAATDQGGGAYANLAEPASGSLLYRAAPATSGTSMAAAPVTSTLPTTEERTRGGGAAQLTPPTSMASAPVTSMSARPAVSAQLAPSEKQVELANKHARFLLSSLQYDDFSAALKYAQLVISNLTGQ